MEVLIREARPADEAATERIEIAADTLLVERFGAVDWPPPTPPHERATAPGFVLVAEHGGDESSSPGLIGFAHVLEIEGGTHLEQLSVLPEFGRRGIGRRLLAAAMAEARRRGSSRMTLRTYADVPWNAPFYASCGFAVTTPDTPLLRSLVQVEEELGLLRHGPRVQMTVRL
ncbi:GNAT family N-acetyltransferase [Microbacterium sp. J1-1]|uniref:GNAT family N-acetyltransferase n=1 Tax=Microbacterium sp. J1-1 TaxID=2992441 RepID=UPI00211524B6|nr:GNAT family N-acetyltransferase [Microbacterium sp. J1-1]UUE19235.1 GNAT family N-acetyltransferase [Microbacterium sp. J1-1]